MVFGAALFAHSELQTILQFQKLVAAENYPSVEADDSDSNLVLSLYNSGQEDWQGFSALHLPLSAENSAPLIFFRGIPALY